MPGTLCISWYVPEQGILIQHFLRFGFPLRHLRRNTDCSLQLKFDILLRKQVNSGAGNPREASMGLAGGVSVIIKIVLLERFLFSPFIWIPAAANLKASHFSEKALCTGGGIVWGLINTKLFQKNLFKHLITCKEMLTCLTPLNYIVTGSFSAYPKPDYNYIFR